MIKEKSCGAITYKIVDGIYYFLIEKMNRGHFSLPKGHVEENETIDECVIREVKEETNLDLISFKLHGEVLFVLNGYEELMYVYTSKEFSGVLKECNEGTLEWVNKSEVLNLPIWEGDKLIFELMNIDEYFKLKLVYENDVLIHVEKY